ncbi:MAG: hypothetical protein C0397_15460 [Odoribacter sp.]|nr:hypothetical protein [Odoribacter sp.]
MQESVLIYYNGHKNILEFMKNPFQSHLPKINLHTHQIVNGGQIQVLNVFAQDLPLNEKKQLFSTGLHPWHIGKVNPEACFQAIELAAKQKNMLAIGECGLDRSISTEFLLQVSHFKKQIEIAEKYQKPLIIHCVRAYSDLMQLKKETKSNVPWLIHGYNGNLETTKNLVRHGFYFSAGEKLLSNESKHAVFLAIPTDRLFLETDDREISIESVYFLAIQVLKIDLNKLAKMIFNNFKILFGDDRLALNNYLT